MMPELVVPKHKHKVTSQTDQDKILKEGQLLDTLALYLAIARKGQANNPDLVGNLKGSAPQATTKEEKKEQGVRALEVQQAREALNCFSDFCAEIINFNELPPDEQKKYATIYQMFKMISSAAGNNLTEVSNDPFVQSLLTMALRDRNGNFVHSPEYILGIDVERENIIAIAPGLANEADAIKAGAPATPELEVVPTPSKKPAAPKLSEDEKTAIEEKEKEKLDTKYRQAFKYFIELGINLDSVAKNPQRLDAYLSSYNAMTSEEQKGFRKFLEEKLVKLMPTLTELKAQKAAGASEEEIGKLMDKASGEVSREELNSMLREMKLGFNIELPEESEAGKGVDLSLTMEKMMRMYVEYSGASSGSNMFDMAGMLKGIQEVRTAFNNYMELSSSTYPGTWGPESQAAFIATLQASDSELAEVRNRYTGTAAQGVRLAMRLRQNMAISDLMVASTFGYDWEQIYNLKTGTGFSENPVFTAAEIEDMRKGESDTVRLAKMHKHLLAMDNFSSGKNSYLEKTGGLTTEEIEDAMTGEVGEAPTPETEAAAAESEEGRNLLGKMDLLTQYVFVMHTWKILENTTLQDYVKEDPNAVDGKVEVADMVNDPLAKPHGVQKVLGVVGDYLDNVGRGGHLGMMLNGVPMAMNYVNSYNEVVDVLGVMFSTSNNISNTNAYSELGAGRVLWYYTMIQVPRNFMQANEDNYNQMIDMMLRNPLASGYMGEYMQKNMFEVQTTREMLQRFLNVYSLRSGAVRPGEIPIYAAPQDFSLADGLDRRSYELGRLARTMLGSAPVGGWENYGVEEGAGQGALGAQDAINERINQMIADSGDQVLSSWWGREKSMHDMFFDFFTPSKVKLVPEKEYAVVPLIPMSLSKLTQLLSMVEGVPRYIAPNSFERGRASARGQGAYHGVTETSEGEGTGGKESQEEYAGQGGVYAFGPETSAGAAGGYQGAETKITAPELEGPPEEGQINNYLDSSKRGYWAAMSRDISTEGWPIIREPLSTSMTAAGSHARQEQTDLDTGENMEVMDDSVRAALEHYAREYNTDGVTLLRWERHKNEETGVESEDLRAYTWGKIKGNWYRVGYMDVSSKDEQGNPKMSAGLKRLFTALNIDNYGEFRQLSGKDWKTVQAEGENGVDVTEKTGEQDWTLYGMLVGINFTNLFTGGEPPGKWNLVGADIYNRSGRPRTERPSLTGGPIPAVAYDPELVDATVQEYAAGVSMLFREISWAESAVGFVTAVGRADLEGKEKLKSGRGGAGFMGRVIVNKAEDRMAEFGAGVGENWGEDTVGFTLAWQDRQILFDKQYNIAIADIVPNLYYGGLVGTMHKGEDLKWFMVGDGYYLSDRAAEKAGVRGYAGELAALETKDVRIQESALFQMTQVRWSLDKVVGRLNAVENKLNEYRKMPPAENVGADIPEVGPLQQEITYGEATQQLEREQNILRRLQTALGLIEAQWFFGTTSVMWKFMDDKARMGIEGIFGGPDEWGALMNSFIEVDRKFAAAFNIQGSETNPKGSVGGKIVVPFSGMILASTLGMYFRDDLKGPNANFGLTYDPIKEYGIGAIIGGMARTGTLASEEGAPPVKTERNVVEGMVLGWMPWWEGSRAQAYFVYAKEWGTNTYSMQEDLNIDRFGAGARLLWVGETGIAYNLEAEWFRKNMGVSLEGVSPYYKQKTDQFSAGFRVKGAENVEGRLQAVATRLESIRNEDVFREADTSKYTRWEYAFFADLFISF